MASAVGECIAYDVAVGQLLSNDFAGVEERLRIDQVHPMELSVQSSTLCMELCTGISTEKCRGYLYRIYVCIYAHMYVYVVYDLGMLFD